MTEQQKCEELLKSRWKVIADYPNAEMPVGLVVTNLYGATWGDGKEYQFDESELWFKRYPHLFRKLEWWEERTLEQFKAVKFVKVTHYVGYWLVGDIAPVDKFVHKDDGITGYDLKYKHFHPLCYVEPSTEQEFKLKNK